ncbi:DUF454 family protein [Metabacillus sp. Hm71]|uniref:DUF454 family protein n=1 Tax=Metabacillus sp. Hm71 TaxID=3450743 RepID=UPI003F4355C8
MIKIVKSLYIFLGFFFFGLGLLGIILPLLPTTPFLLLASFFFVKGSEKFEIWFKGTDVYKNHLEGFVKNKAMTLKQKLTILIFADCMIAIPFILVDSILIRVILLIIVGYKYYYFIWKIKTVT